MNAYPPKSAPEPSGTPSLDEILERNIQAVLEKRRQEATVITKHQGVAMAIGDFIGSFGFIYAHLLLFGGWILANTVGLPGIPMFDPELVLVATFAAGGSTANDIEGGTQLGGHDPNQRGFTVQGAELAADTPEEFSAYIRSQIAKWAKVIKASGAHVD